ncbi:MAG: ester cyclase [archaeon]|nr:ester cyclase [archaeon]
MIEAENKHNPTLLDEFIAPDFVDEPDTPKETRGLESLKQRYTQFYKGFPDFHGTIEDIIAEGDKVWIRFKGRNTQRRMERPSSLYWQDGWSSILIQGKRSLICSITDI